MIIYFESHGVARVLRLNSKGKPMIDVKKAQAKTNMTKREHGIAATKGDIIVVTKSHEAAALPEGWEEAKLDNGTTFYYNKHDTSEVAIGRPGGDGPDVVSDIWEGYIEVASVHDAVSGRFPRTHVEELPHTHRLSGEVMKYSIEWDVSSAPRSATHAFKLIEARGHEIHGIFRLPTAADKSSGSNLHLLHNDPTLPGYYLGDPRHPTSGRPPPSAFREPHGALSLTRGQLRNTGNWHRFLPAMTSLAVLCGGDDDAWQLAGKYLQFRWAVENPTPESEAQERVAKGDFVMGLMNRLAGNNIEGDALPPSPHDRAKAAEATRILSQISQDDVKQALKASHVSAAPDKAQYAKLIAALQSGHERTQVDAIRRQAALVAVGIAAKNAKQAAKPAVQATVKDLEIEEAVAKHKQQVQPSITLPVTFSPPVLLLLFGLIFG